MHGTILKALQQGDTAAVVAWHRNVFGDARMADDDKADDKKDDKTDDGAEDEDDLADVEGADELGDKGKQALRAERKARRDAEQKLADRERADRETERKKRADARRDRAKGKDDDGKDDDGKKTDVEKLRTEIRAEQLLERVEDKIEARVAKLADPEVAEALLRRRHKLEEFVLDGKVDLDAIDDAINELLEDKPHLDPKNAKKDDDDKDDDGESRRDRSSRRFGDADQGARRRSRPNQLRRDDLRDMSPQEIAKARKDGRLNDLLSGRQK